MQNLEDKIAAHDNNYNLLRLLLAASVIFYHSYVLAPSTEPASALDIFLVQHGGSLGQFAVGGFFFISGIFVSQSYYRDRNSLHFFIRRFCRIWPGYFVCLCVTATVACILSQRTHALHYILSSGFFRYIGSNALFSMNWTIPGVFEQRAEASINGAIHTLPTEVKMYALVLAVGCFVPFKSKRRIAGVAAVFLVIATVFFKRFSKPLFLNPDAQMYVLMFFSGVMAFAVARYVKPYLWLGAVLIALAVLVPDPWNRVTFFLATGWIVVFMGHLKLRWAPRTDLSYGVYIYGWPSQQFVATFLPGIHPTLHSVLAVALSAGFAFASWHLIEKPAMDYGRSAIAKLG